MEGKEDPVLSADLIDGITEAVVKPADPSVRAAVIADLVHEVDEAVKWRHELDPGKEEEQSVGKLVEAAASHQQRMDEMDGSADDMPEIEDDQDKRG